MKPENPYKDKYLEFTNYNGRELGWQEGYEACEKFWFEPCTEHPTYRTNGQYCGSGDPCFDKAFYEHRYLCPECRKEIGL